MGMLGRMPFWAMDLGTTNTGLARWDDAEGRPRLVELPDICRRPGGGDPLEAPRLVPSATHLLPEQGLLDRIGRWPLVARRFFLGRQALIGRPALEANQGPIHPNYVASFKPYLGRESLRTLARVDGRLYSTREVARVFLRELLASVRRHTGERIRALTLTSPVDAYESYRAELSAIGRSLGVRRVRFLDEPVAAALGYGLGIERDRLVLVVDFGGGTLDVALSALGARGVREGRCHVLAKDGRPIGGNLVDRWLLAEFCRKLDYPISERAGDTEQAFWFRLMLAEACRVKEAIFFHEEATFYLTPPEEMRSFEARVRGEAHPLKVSREDLGQILSEGGLYEALSGCVEGVLDQAASGGISPADISDVLLVGGSTLLPGVYPLFEERFGRDRVRAWQPFEAVAYGACVMAAESFQHSDLIVHDYAFVTYDARTHERQYSVIVPRGTRFPTPPDFWKRQLVPTCSLGEPETMFKLLICEIGRAQAGERRFAWDRDGTLHKLGGEGGSERLVVPLNEANPTLGYLDPPHSPSDRRPRLEIAFGINAEQWLCATVHDLRTKKHLMRGEPVVRLL
jgi:molecular chaperone DnaK (HSP70)